MRISVELNTESGASALTRAPSADPALPNLTFLTQDFASAARSFYATVDRILADNPVDVGRLMELSRKAGAGALAEVEVRELQALKVQALRQGRAVGAVIGFFLKFRPYPMLAEIRGKGAIFQPVFGPVLVVEADAVRELLERNQEFTVDPYGAEMVKVMTPRHNGGRSTFVLSTDDTAAYEPDKRLLSIVCNRDDVTRIEGVIHDDCMRRVRAGVHEARASSDLTIDVVQRLARYVPVTLGHAYLGVPVASSPGSFELTDEMLAYYGEPIDGQADTALGRGDGVIPDEAQMYGWIKAAFQHFFNNVQKDPAVQLQGFRACRLLLAYLLREIGIQRQLIQRGDPVAETMLTRLLHFQLGHSTPGARRPDDLDPSLVNDLRIAENVMGTIVGAVAGQEEATSRVVDSLVRLKDGEYRTSGSPQVRYGTFAEARGLALDVLSGRETAAARRRLYGYFLEALRLQPQGEVLLRKCARDGAQIAGSRPIAAGTFVFAAHGAAMKQVQEPDAFILDRPREHYLHYGWSRHTCLGQYVSPVIIVESMIALLGLEGLERGGPLQLDDQNLYATSLALRFADAGTTRQYFPVENGMAT